MIWDLLELSRDVIFLSQFVRVDPFLTQCDSHFNEWGFMTYPVWLMDTGNSRTYDRLSARITVDLPELQVLPFGVLYSPLEDVSRHARIPFCLRYCAAESGCTIHG
jgi:hypothetical protein